MTHQIYLPHTALSDQGYRVAIRAGIYPKVIACPDCKGAAPFRDDTMAARYECEQCGHSTAAMYADPAVVGEDALN